MQALLRNLSELLERVAVIYFFFKSLVFNFALGDECFRALVRRVEIVASVSNVVDLFESAQSRDDFNRVRLEVDVDGDEVRDEFGLFGQCFRGCAEEPAEEVLVLHVSGNGEHILSVCVDENAEAAGFLAVAELADRGPGQIQVGFRFHRTMTFMKCSTIWG